jgi:hypothetical protein
MTTESQCLSIRARIAKLEAYITNNPHISTVEREQLEELKREQREQQSGPIDVLY